MNRERQVAPLRVDSNPGDKVGDGQGGEVVVRALVGSS